ncbi:hypothetical protein [Methanocorpusculum vombati]|uniref:DUF3821 domain-containing protein n=1 Tax=Methanocorpusculum vombati TaxID=3002864 RepID=A0ABT4IKY9_9EURY|nr:hypothetical protein [Methanocorpusculum vombati]MCZ9319170.1 hypothetical protein [Methanocorpusculum sp.]MCZ0861753.1 hypothetical protein [Methanocorpusculum vombati]MDE2521277.1 hypothetical protein [Methanocorpusculum sp.]MDE2535014.1 hypothetical protein [Methanocorpusculum sp.]MDE2545562.1 hypothetical protein [Methanocorpusculum sp.]
MNPKKILIISLLAILLCSLLTGGAAARYTTPEGMNAGITNGDFIYVGETQLNFSDLTEPGKTLIGLVYLESSAQKDVIPISNNIASQIQVTNYGFYSAKYSDGTISSTKGCWVRQLSLGSIAVVAADDPNGSPITGSDISKDLGVIFYMTGQNIQSNQLTDWFEYEITMPSGLKSTTVRNQNGAQVSLSSSTQHNDPSQKYQDFAFHFSDQVFVPTIDPGQTLPGVSIAFKIKNLNGLTGQQVLRSITLTSVRPTLTLDTSRLESDRQVTVTLSGTAATEYPLVIAPAGDNRPYFVDDGKITVINNQSITVTTDNTGKYTVLIKIPDNVITGEYTVSTIYSVSATFTVAKPPVVTLYFDEPPADVLAGKFAVGDQIYLTGRVSGLDICPVYLYITGPNLPANGASLEYPSQEVVDGDPSTFTVTTYSSNLGYWAYYWQTRGFEPGSYTIHANLNPIGQKESGKPGGAGTGIDGDVALSHDYTISEQSIQVKSSDKTGGYFAKGDILYSWWIARGSPGVGAGHPGGEVRWYIFGTNFRYADREVDFPLYGGGTTDSSGSSSSSSSDNSRIGKEAPWGEYGMTYNRTFTYGLSPGTYYLVYQHPGPNNVFDIYADGSALNGGTLTTVSTTYGSSSDFTYMQGKAAADALTKMFEDPKSDDLYVMTQFIVEDPWITFDTLGTVAVGDKLKISGKTNLATSDKTADKTETKDTLWLTISRLDLDTVADTSTAMKIPVDTTTPSSPTPFRGYRTFSYDEIDTSSWYPGTYEATITCKDVNFKQSYSFEILSADAKAAATTAVPTRDPAFSEHPYPATEATPLKTPTQAATAWTPVPTLAAAPGFGFGLVILGLALSTLAVRIRRR